MDNVKKYEIVFSNDMKAFGYAVNKKLNEGWKCQGGIYVEKMVTVGNYYYQAMIYDVIK